MPQPAEPVCSRSRSALSQPNAPPNRKGTPPHRAASSEENYSGTGILPTTSTPGSLPSFGLTTTVSAWPGMIPTSP